MSPQPHAKAHRNINALTVRRLIAGSIEVAAHIKARTPAKVPNTCDMGGNGDFSQSQLWSEVDLGR